MTQAKITKSFNSWIPVSEIEKFEKELKSKGFEIEEVSVLQYLVQKQFNGELIAFMNKPVGGRGRKAPYETQLIRVPVPVYAQVEKIADDYRKLVIEGEENSVDENSDIPNDVTFVNYSDALQRAKEIVSQNKSARISLAKLLQVLYGGRVRPEDLK
jgi:hypothetical protein